MMSNSSRGTGSAPTMSDAVARGGGRVVDVTALIDGTPAGGFQYRTLALCMGVLFFDGYDTQAVGYAAPALVPALHIERSSMAWVFAISLVGLMIGACIFG